MASPEDTTDQFLLAVSQARNLLEQPSSHEAIYAASQLASEKAERLDRPEAAAFWKRVAAAALWRASKEHADGAEDPAV